MTREEMERLVGGLYFENEMARWGGYTFHKHLQTGNTVWLTVAYDATSFRIEGKMVNHEEVILEYLTDMFETLRKFVEDHEEQ